VVRQLPIWTNYFWTLYLRGAYTRACCPEYLKKPNFLALKNGLADRITPYTCTVTEFLHRAEGRISKLVLLDHMDWMASYHPEALVEEWNAILARAADRTRVIFRSAHAEPAYLDFVRVGHGPAQRPLRDAVRFHPALAQDLSRADRVHTYAGFHIADLRADPQGA
jgi:S-adenosylmethionine-diacylglycerol 3-amino-3-carboxypropyl transferase